MHRQSRRTYHTHVSLHNFDRSCSWFFSLLSVPARKSYECIGNCLGDVAVSTIVAKQEGVLDMEKYNHGIPGSNDPVPQPSMIH